MKQDSKIIAWVTGIALGFGGLMSLIALQGSEVKKARFERTYQKFELKYADTDNDGVISDVESERFRKMYKEIYYIGYEKGKSLNNF